MGLNNKPGMHRIDTALLLSSGAVEGPRPRPRAHTVTLRMRIARLLRRVFNTNRSPL